MAGGEASPGADWDADRPNELAKDREYIAEDAADEQFETEEQELAGAPGEAAPTPEEVAGEDSPADSE